MPFFAKLEVSGFAQPYYWSSPADPPCPAFSTDLRNGLKSTVYSKFAPVPIRPTNQLDPRKYGASRYPVLPAKLLAAYRGLK